MVPEFRRSSEYRQLHMESGTMESPFVNSNPDGRNGCKGDPVVAKLAKWYLLFNSAA